MSLIGIELCLLAITITISAGSIMIGREIIMLIQALNRIAEVLERDKSDPV